MKKVKIVLCGVMMLLLLTACGSKPAPTVEEVPASEAFEEPGIEDSLDAAKQEFNNAVDNLSNVQNDLNSEISIIETLLESVIEEDVTDVMVLSELRTVLENTKNMPKPTIPEMGSSPEEIQRQQQSIAEQANTISSLCYDLRFAVSRVEASRQAKRAEYENRDAFDAARELGYEVEELGNVSSNRYYVSFSYNEASFLISSAKEPSGDILFYGKKVNETDLTWGTFAFTSFNFSDGSKVSRDSKGHWTFSTDQKEQLVNMLTNFKKSGPSSFMDVLTPVDSNYLSPEMSTLIRELGLNIAYQKASGGYRFMVSDGENLAWFFAKYSEADFRPSDDAEGLNTYIRNENKYNIAGFYRSSFLTDYVNKSGHLISEPERADQLRSFFSERK